MTKKTQKVAFWKGKSPYFREIYSRWTIIIWPPCLSLFFFALFFFLVVDILQKASGAASRTGGVSVKQLGGHKGFLQEILVFCLPETNIIRPQEKLPSSQ